MNRPNKRRKSINERMRALISFLGLLIHAIVLAFILYVIIRVIIYLVSIM